jgi:signal transduction histidine kinase/ActR/RegA family two-component response regulator
MSHIHRTLNVIVVENGQSDYTKLIAELERVNGKVYLKQVDNLGEFRNQLRNHSWDLIVSDFKLNTFSALEALQVTQGENLEVPFVLMSHGLGEERVADMIKAGVEDVVLWNRLERLHPVVKRIMKIQDHKSKEARVHKIASEAFAAKEQMLAIVSHDIKNPISAIQLEAQMLLKASENTLGSSDSSFAKEVKLQASRILKTTERMKVLISDLLDKNKTENCLAQLNKKESSVNRVVQDVIENLRPLITEKEVSINVHIPEGTFVLMDKNKIFQVLSNLISNGIKFSPRCGTITIKCYEAEDQYTFLVQDSGPGLKDKDLSRVFEKYWTGGIGGHSGTGLGLFICKTIVEAHGGKIFAENHQKSGATFKFTLPKYESEEMPHSLQNSSFKSSQINAMNDHLKKIYIIDDDDDLREVMAWILTKEGYSILSFSSALKALKVLSEDDLPPDLLILDFHLHEMKGHDFLQKKHALVRNSDCPVIMITASLEEMVKKIPTDLQMDVMTKPLDLEGLVEKVKNHIQNPASVTPSGGKHRS